MSLYYLLFNLNKMVYILIHLVGNLSMFLEDLLFSFNSNFKHQQDTLNSSLIPLAHHFNISHKNYNFD